MENNTTVHVSDFDKICRTCLSTQEIQPISDLKHNKISIISFLYSCASVRVEKDDNLPQNLCSVCLKEIIKIHEFQEKCRQNESVLRLTFTETKVIKYDVEDEIIIKQEEVFEMPTNSFYSGSETDKITEEKLLHEDIKEENKVYSCHVCLEEFATRDQLEEHRKEVKHQKVQKHACSVCNKMCASSSKLQQHMRVHTKEKPYKCTVCLQSFTLSVSLKRHMMTHSGEPPHVCQICGKGFIQASNLKNHLKKHSSCERTELVCSVCGWRFKYFNTYKTHLRKHDVKKLEEKERKLVEEDVHEHVCEICKRVYRSKISLKRHLLMHGEKKFLCSHCGKSFITKASLQLHLRLHTGEKPHTCNYCSKSFARLEHFNVHMLIHTGEKPYRCNICTKAFRQQSDLRKHLRAHNGEKPHSCTYCGKTFTTKHCVTVHIRTHTGETPYECSVCGKRFYHCSNFKRHQKGHEVTNLQTSDGDEAVVEDLKD